MDAISRTSVARTSLADTAGAVVPVPRPPCAPGRVGLAFAGFLALLAPTLGAQEGELRVDRITVEDGLSHGMVWSIHQDRRGFLWFATSQGLNRYDGHDFEVYRSEPDDPMSISGSDVSEVMVDHVGELWAGTRGAGLNRFVRAQEGFEHFLHDPEDPTSLSHDVVTYLYEDRAGTLWVGTNDGLNRFHRGAGRFTRYRIDPDDPVAPTSLGGRRVEAMLEDGGGDFWVGTDGGLARFDREAERFFHFRHDPSEPGSLSAGTVFSLAEGPGGELWIGTDRGLDRLDRDRLGRRPLDSGGVRFEHFRHDPADPGSLSQGRVSALLFDGRGDLWAGTLSGLARFDRATGRFRRHHHDPADPWSLTSDSISCLHEDRNGLIWIGTLVGVSKFVPRQQQFVTYRHRSDRDDTLSSNNVGAVIEDRSGTLWVGTFDRGLDRLDRENGAVVHYRADPDDPGSLRSGTVTALLEDSSGVLWVGTFGGLATFDRERGRFVHHPHVPGDPTTPSSDLVLTLYEDREGRLWVGTVDGVDRYDPATGRFHRYARRGSIDAPDRLGRLPFYSILQDRSGTLWFGSEIGGLYRLESGVEDPETARFERFRHDPEDPSSPGSDRVAAIHQDRRGYLWIGSWDAGLDRFDPERGEFRHFRRRDGLPSDMVLAILEDDDGELWLSTGRGLSRFDPETESFSNYDVEDGLPGDSFTFGSAFRSPSGRMFFGGTQGLVAFHPDEIGSDRRPPPVVITELQLANEPAELRRLDPESPLERSILVTEELVLPPREYVFSFEFAALDFAKPRRTRYAYRLDGLDQRWLTTDASKRFARYAHLAPGEYTFRVRGANGDGVWNPAEASVRLVVLPPWWRSPWAYVLYTAVLVLAAGGYFRSQRRKVERERSINDQLREIDRLKDRLLAERAGELAERERLIAELEQRNAELERFTYTLSHDLKTPLVTIKNFLGLVRRDAEVGDFERLGHDLDRIGVAADRMRQLLEELLDFSRVGHRMAPPEEVPFGELTREATELLEDRIDEIGGTLTIAPDLPVVLGDRVRLREVVQNLVENAIKYRDGRPPRIEVGSRHQGGETVLFVRDHGLGVDPRYRKKIFGLFERLETGTEGTGVGLALVKRIVELHGGRIWVESEGKGQGSTFCFTLPTAPSDDAETRRVAVRG